MKLKNINNIVYVETDEDESYIRLNENNWLELIGSSFEYYHDSEYLEEIYQQYIQ